MTRNSNANIPLSLQVRYVTQTMNPLNIPRRFFNWKNNTSFRKKNNALGIALMLPGFVSVPAGSVMSMKYEGIVADCNIPLKNLHAEMRDPRTVHEPEVCKAAREASNHGKDILYAGIAEMTAATTLIVLRDSPLNKRRPELSSITP